MCSRHFIIQNLRVQLHLHSAMTPTSHSWEAWPGLCCSGAWDIIIPHQPTIHTHSSRPFNVLRAAMKQPMSKVLICPERACAHTSLFHCLNEASWASRVTGSLELGSGRAELVDLILCEDSGNCERRLRGPCRALPAQREVFLPGWGPPPIPQLEPVDSETTQTSHLSKLICCTIYITPEFAFGDH